MGGLRFQVFGKSILTWFLTVIGKKVRNKLNEWSVKWKQARRAWKHGRFWWNSFPSKSSSGGSRCWSAPSCWFADLWSHPCSSKLLSFRRRKQRRELFLWRNFQILSFFHPNSTAIRCCRRRTRRFFVWIFYLKKLKKSWDRKRTHPLPSSRISMFGLNFWDIFMLNCVFPSAVMYSTMFSVRTCFHSPTIESIARLAKVGWRRLTSSSSLRRYPSPDPSCESFELQT